MSEREGRSWISVCLLACIAEEGGRGGRDRERERHRERHANMNYIISYEFHTLNIIHTSSCTHMYSLSLYLSLTVLIAPSSK